MSDAAIVILAVGGAIVALVVLFVAIGFIMSLIGGWRALAAQFRATAPPLGTRFDAVTARIGFVNYNSVLTAYVSNEGLYLSIAFLFRLSHPDLFIPWRAVTKRQERRVLLFDAVDLTIGEPRIATILLPKRVMAGAP